MRSILLFLAFVACNNGSNSNAPAPANSPAPVSGAKAPTVAAAPGVVASWDGGSVSYDEFEKGMVTKIAKMEADYLTSRYEAESDALNDKINEAILDAEAKKLGLADKDALMKQEVEDKVTDPTEAEISDAYAQISRRPGTPPLEQIHDRVAQMVKQKKQSERGQAYMDELRTKYHVNMALPYPDLPRIPVSVDDDPSQGNAQGKVTIVQFAEYQCPYCGKAQETMDQVMKTYEGQIHFVFRDFPLSFHDRAIPAAIAANCAAKQGEDKYWKVHSSFMANQRALQDADLEKAASDAGVDMAAWNECRKDPAVVDEIHKDMKDGEEAGVTGTPAFFINGVFLNGAQPFDKFKVVIDRELAKG